MTPKERKKQQFENTVNSAIIAATVVKNTGDTMPLLRPLKGLMGPLIALMENVKVGPLDFLPNWILNLGSRELKSSKKIGKGSQFILRAGLRCSKRTSRTNQQVSSFKS
jgi:hypothetical protein